jgi:hypothetical protein
MLLDEGSAHVAFAIGSRGCRVVRQDRVGQRRRYADDGVDVAGAGVEPAALDGCAVASDREVVESHHGQRVHRQAATELAGGVPPHRDVGECGEAAEVKRATVISRSIVEKGARPYGEPAEAGDGPAKPGGAVARQYAARDGELAAVPDGAAVGRAPVAQRETAELDGDVRGNLEDTVDRAAIDDGAGRLVADQEEVVEQVEVPCRGGVVDAAEREAIGPRPQQDDVLARRSLAAMTASRSVQLASHVPSAPSAVVDGTKTAPEAGNGFSAKQPTTTDQPPTRRIADGSTNSAWNRLSTRTPPFEPPRAFIAVTRCSGVDWMAAAERNQARSDHGPDDDPSTAPTWLRPDRRSPPADAHRDPFGAARSATE